MNNSDANGFDMSDGSGDENVPFARCDWAELVSILRLGRLYE